MCCLLGQHKLNVFKQSTQHFSHAPIQNKESQWSGSKLARRVANPNLWHLYVSDPLMTACKGPNTMWKHIEQTNTQNQTSKRLCWIFGLSTWFHSRLWKLHVFISLSSFAWCLSFCLTRRVKNEPTYYILLWWPWAPPAPGSPNPALTSSVVLNSSHLEQTKLSPLRMGCQADPFRDYITNYSKLKRTKL